MERTKNNVALIHEDNLLGTAKTLIENRKFFSDEVGY